jgi:hypothetical protein
VESILKTFYQIFRRRKFVIFNLYLLIRPISLNF